MGFNLYLCCLVLCIFDTAKPALVNLNIKKHAAIIYILLVMLTSLLEDIFLLDNFSVSIAGCIMPILLCVKLMAKLGSKEATRTMLRALISSAGSWAVVQVFSQSTDVLNLDLAWIRGLSTMAFTMMFTLEHSPALATALLSFLLSGYWNHLDMMISGLPDYWAAGSGIELAVTATICMVIPVVCQLFFQIRKTATSATPPEPDNGYTAGK